MKLTMVLAIILIIIVGYLIVQYSLSGPAANTTHAISGTQDLVLNEQDLQQLGMTSNWAECQTDEQTSFDLSPVQYTFCNYSIDSLSDTEVFLEMKKFTNLEELDNTYQYESSHLFGAKGLISENTFGDHSRFRVNSDDDYGAEFNEPGVYFYHLWICKNEYFIHITSKGAGEAEGYIAETGRLILSKFG